MRDARSTAPDSVPGLPSLLKMLFGVHNGSVVGAEGVARRLDAARPSWALGRLGRQWGSPWSARARSKLAQAATGQQGVTHSSRRSSKGGGEPQEQRERSTGNSEGSAAALQVGCLPCTFLQLTHRAVHM